MMATQISTVVLGGLSGSELMDEAGKCVPNRDICAVPKKVSILAVVVEVEHLGNARRTCSVGKEVSEASSVEIHAFTYRTPNDRTGIVASLVLRFNCTCQRRTAGRTANMASVRTETPKHSC